MRPSKSKKPAGRKKPVRRNSRPHAAKAVALNRLRDPVRLALEHAEDVARRPKRAKRAATPQSEMPATQGGSPVTPARELLELLGPQATSKETSSKEVELIISASEGNVFESMFASQTQLFATLLRWPVGLLVQQQALLAQLVFNNHYPQKPTTEGRA